MTRDVHRKVDLPVQHYEFTAPNPLVPLLRSFVKGLMVEAGLTVR